jgi:hypothetical protein
MTNDDFKALGPIFSATAKLEPAAREFLRDVPDDEWKRCEFSMMRRGDRVYVASVIVSAHPIPRSRFFGKWWAR